MKYNMITDEIMEVLLSAWDQMTITERENFSISDAIDWCNDEVLIDGLHFEPESILQIIMDFNENYGIDDSQ